MVFRPTQTNWFETYIPRSETVHALEVLACTGIVELELDHRLTAHLNLNDVREPVDEFLRLSRSYKDFLPDGESTPAGLVDTPERVAKDALSYLKEWCGRTNQLIHRRKDLEKKHEELLLLRELLDALHGSLVNVAEIAHQTGFLYKAVFVCPAEHTVYGKLNEEIYDTIQGTKNNFYLVAGLPEKKEEIWGAFSPLCRQIEIPSEFPMNPGEQQAWTKSRLEAVAKEAEQVDRDLRTHKKDPGLTSVRKNVSLLRWYLEHAGELSEVSHYCHVTGWTTSPDPRILQRALDRTGVHAKIRFAKPPPFSEAPVRMLQAWWVRPFEIFVNMFGTPSRKEVDPSGLLPLIIPMIFGYMFPDVGHGMVLVLIGVLMHRRWPEVRFLIPCGLSAALFGVVFGEVFGLETLIPALWIRPLENPLEVLLAPLVFGVGLILLGLIFSGVEAYWRSEFRSWVLREAPVLVLYATTVGGVFFIELFWIAALSLFWFVLGHLAFFKIDRFANLLKGFGSLFQSALGLILNTISFFRVGAFALAHAGLSSAILTVVSGIENRLLSLILLVIGHGFIVILEGLIVFVQTTRLVLFEFFIRFLRAEGRVFQPLTAPSGRSPGER